MAQLPSDTTPIDKVIQEWWYSMSGDSLRLSAMGDKMFRLAQIEYFDLPLTVNQQSWFAFIVDCNKKLKCPYFISANKKDSSTMTGPFIRLYDSKIAMLMTLYGDIHSYLKSIKSRNN